MSVVHACLWQQSAGAANAVIADQNQALAKCHSALSTALLALTWYHGLAFENEDGLPVGKEIIEALSLLRGREPTKIVLMSDEQ